MLNLVSDEHQVIAFVAPKIIGGTTAPTPVGELGMVEMTQALQLSDVNFEAVSSALSTFMYVLTVRILHHDLPQINLWVVTILDPIMIRPQSHKKNRFFHRYDTGKLKYYELRNLIRQ